MRTVAGIAEECGTQGYTGPSEHAGSIMTASQEAAYIKALYALQDGDVYILLFGALEDRQNVLQRLFDSVKDTRRCVYIKDASQFSPKTVFELEQAIAQAVLAPSASQRKVTIFINDGDEASDCFLQFVEAAASYETEAVAQILVGSAGALLERLDFLRLCHFERRLAVRCNLSKAV